MNNRSIPSMHAERKITVCSHKYSFTPYPSLSPYRQMDRMTDRGTNTLAAPGLEELFFQLCCCVCFLALAGNRFWCCILTYFEYNTVVVLCSFFGSGGTYILVLHMYLVYNICVVVLVFG